jgi:hypothetical protein
MVRETTEYLRIVGVVAGVRTGQPPIANQKRCHVKKLGAATI